MSRKAIVATALAVGLGVVFAAFTAADRGRARDNRATRGATLRSGEVRNLADTFHPLLSQVMATTELQYVGGQGALSMDPTIGESIETKASHLIQFSQTQEPQQAQATLRSVLDLGLEKADNGRARKMLASTYEQLASFQEGAPARQAYLLAQAAAATTDDETRNELMAQAASLDAGLQVVDIVQQSQNPGSTTMDFGSDDSCSGALAVGAPSVTLMSIANPIGSFQDRNFLEIVIPSGLGLALEIETTSSGCSTDASCSTAAFDTDLSLWQMCDGGFEDMLLDRDPDGDSGVGWLSKIETTCLIPDRYFLEVTGQFGAAPKNFKVEIRVTGTCEVPVPDAWEDDNTTADANAIGHPNSIPDHATGWRGREQKEIQDHSIFPRNENDNMIIDLSRNETVLMVAQHQVSSMVEGLPDIGSGPSEDSQMLLLYKNDPHGGVCNHVPLSIANYCKSSGDCPTSGTPAVPSLPVDSCIPLSQVVFPGEAVPRFGVENPLVFNDDANPAAGNLGSQLSLCLPRTQAQSGTLANEQNPFVMRARGWRPPFSGSVSTLVYDYQAKGQNQGPCTSYEIEPNNSFADATQTPDEAVYIVNGTWEGSETFPLSDVDVWGPFDIESAEEYTIEVFPFIINPFGDAEVQIWAGPSDSGDFMLVASDPDTGKPNARINMILSPPDELLGNTIADAKYYIVVGSDTSQPVPNWRYNMRVLTPRVDALDIEPNDFVPQDVEYRGNTIITGQITARTAGGVCDIDRFHYRLNENQFMTFWTLGPTDTVIHLESVTAGDWPACGVNGCRVMDLNLHFPNTAQQPLTGEFSLGYSTEEYTSSVANAGFGVRPTPDNMKGRVVLALDSTAIGASPTDCCGPIENASAVAGWIALCDRGTCGFAVKAKNAQNAGAAAVIIANVASSSSPQTGPLMGGKDATVTIPCASTAEAAGTKMKSAATAGATIRVSLDNRRHMACDDDSSLDPDFNPYLSSISGCLPPGDYVLSTRGWSTSFGPYVYTFRGVAGCVPTTPPTINAGNTGSFCPPNGYERSCIYP